MNQAFQLKKFGDNFKYSMCRTWWVSSSYHCETRWKGISGGGNTKTNEGRRMILLGEKRAKRWETPSLNIYFQYHYTFIPLQVKMNKYQIIYKT